MKSKHLGKIIGLLVLMFASTFGQLAEATLQQGASYESSMGYCFLLTIANLALVSIIMMVIPFICRLIAKDKLDYKKGKSLCLWNSIILFAISSVFLINTESNFIGGVGAIIYYFINKWVFVSEKVTLAPVVDNTAPTQQVPTNSATKSPNPIVTSASLPIDSQTVQHTTIDLETPPKVKSITKYCSRCGKPIDPISKKCTGCGKQYFKGISLKTFGIVFGICFLVVSLIMNIILAVKLQKKQEELKQQDQEGFYEWLDKQELQEKADFMDAHIVFVEDDNTNLYHKFECDRFPGEYFLALNTEAAISDGFKPCPLCID